MNHQGHHLTQEKLDRIRHLLETTDLDIPAIALRMGCSRGKVSAVNTKYKIRYYGKHKTSFELRGKL